MSITRALGRALRIGLFGLLCVKMAPAGVRAPALHPPGPASGGLRILSGDSWRCFKGTSEPPPAWTTVAFDDSSWSLGVDNATNLAESPAVYLRRQFMVPAPAAVAGLTLSVNYNDGFVAFINGTEVARRSTTGPAAVIDLGASSRLLVAGKNVLAIQGSGVAVGDGDFSLITELAAAACDPSAISCSDGNGCTTDECSGGACAHTYAPSPSCCLTGSQCDDGSPLTIDVCSGGTCSNAPTAGCASNAECNDGDACTADACVSSQTANVAALSFNGSSQYVRTADAAPELGSPTFTVEAWIKWDGTTGAGTGTGAGGLSSVIPLVAKGRAEQDASAVDINYFFGIDVATKKLAADFEEAMGVCDEGTNPGAPCSWRCSTTTATVCAQDSQCPAGETCTAVNGCTGGGTCIGRAGLNHPILGKTAFATTPAAPWVAGWNHVAVTYNGTCWTLYVNGVDDTDTPNQCPAATPRSDNSAPLGIATAFTSTPTAAGFFGGQMDEVRIWSYARSQAQILATKNQQVGTDTGLLGAWAFNEATGTTAADTAGTNNQGTLTGSPTWVTGAANVVDLGPTSCVNTPLNCGQ